MPAPSVVASAAFNKLPANYPSAPSPSYGDATLRTNIDGSKMYVFVTQADPVLADLSEPVTYYSQIVNTNSSDDIQSVVLKVVTLGPLPGSGSAICGVALYQIYGYNPATSVYSLAAEYALKLDVDITAKTATISSAIGWQQRSEDQKGPLAPGQVHP